MAIKEVDDQTFERETLDGVVLVDFYATWCGPCKMLAPVLEEVDAELGDTVKILKVDVDEAPVIAGEYQILSVPSLLLFVEGEVKARTGGFLPKALLVEFIENNR